ncbi:MAG TPA: membrane dipeptidase, partial [Gemmatimonadota bacterium]|nr:membrane dipeptidase [Gemmatimonadota bacterium]
QGGYGVIWAAHHVPEQEMFEQCTVAEMVASVLVPRFFEKMSGSQFNRVIDMIDVMELEVGKHPDRAEVAVNAADVKRIQGEGKIAVVHCIEGGHVLEDEPDDVESNLAKLAGRGVAMITLCHFYNNGIAMQTDGIPPDNTIKKLCKLEFGSSAPLTDFGRTVVRKMNQLSMIVDVAHCTPEARAEIYAEIGDRPVMASHVGCRKYMDVAYNPTDDELRHIASTGGAVGVIFMTYWLDESHPDDGLDCIWNTMEHMHDVMGSWDHIVIGTDFDGFTDPPDDVVDASQVGKVTQLMLDRGVPEDDVKKVLGGNAQRVLELGWR